MIRKASVVPLKEPRLLRGVGESGFDQVFTEFRVLHLVVSEYQQVIGVIGETDDPQTPFYIDDENRNRFPPENISHNFETTFAEDKSVIGCYANGLGAVDEWSRRW